MINEERVTEIFMNCAFRENYELDYQQIFNIPKEKRILGNGILTSIYLKKDNLESYSEEIKSMIEELPDGLDYNYGDCFESMFMCEDLEYWTCYHRVVEQLLMLGNALGYLEFVDTGIEGKMKNIKRGI